MKGTVIVPLGSGRMGRMHDGLASMDIPQARLCAHRRHACRDGSLSIPCSCRWSRARASARRPSSRRWIRRWKRQGVTPAQQEPRAV